MISFIISISSRDHFGYALVQVHHAPDLWCLKQLAWTSSSRHGACTHDGFIASSTVCVDVTMSLVQVTPDIQPASQRCTISAPKDHAVAWADELALDTHVASMALHGRSSVASAARPLHGVVSIGASVPAFKGILLVDAGLTIRRPTLSSSSAPFRWQRRTVTRLSVDLLTSLMMI